MSSSFCNSFSLPSVSVNVGGIDIRISHLFNLGKHSLVALNHPSSLTLALTTSDSNFINCVGRCRLVSCTSQFDIEDSTFHAWSLSCEMADQDEGGGYLPCTSMQCNLLCRIHGALIDQASHEGTHGAQGLHGSVTIPMVRYVPLKDGTVQ